MRKKKWFVRLSKEEEKMLQEVTKREGFQKPSEWFRYVLRREYERLERENHERAPQHK